MLNPLPHQLYIAGRWCDARSGRVETVFNPATEAALADVAFGAMQDIDDAVVAAAAIQSEWGMSSGRERGAFLRAIADGVQQQQEQLAQLQTANNGKPLSEALIDVGDVVATFNYYAGLAEQLDDHQDQPVALPGAGFSATLRHEPCGIAALIVPWNFPMVTTAWKVAPALAAGCTVVLKPSEIAPLPELALAAIIAQAGLPAGVFNLVTGDAEAGAALVSHPAVRKVSFTGSTAVGQTVMKTAADDLKRISLELGGKSAALVFADADIELALEIVCGGIFFNAGQMCSATSRLLVERSVAQDFMARLKQRVESIKVGDPMDPATQMGPLSSRRQHQKVQQYIQQGVAAGLKLVTGGTQPPGMAKGYFVAPTIFADVPFDSPLWREEIFGPVLCINTFDSEQEAVAVANQSEYGLVATVLTSDPERASRVSAALEVGLVWVNSPQVIFPQASWGGMKKSSLGRELGPWGLQAFQEIKHVIVAASG
ncbi:aminoaldehyde dehydrogenase [Collimonas fungivorans]|uniref:aldehyde dehydrogenase (NAD(+)) n=2 Tax=Collimonas fungivorans TaxID=158899 RepID=A0A127P8V8_9BURK|nr:aminoaldehyde dehydrogenase [Collimonas fungivorans]